MPIPRPFERVVVVDRRNLLPIAELVYDIDELIEPIAAAADETPVKMDGIIRMIDEATPVKARGPYKKRNGPEISN